VNQLAIVGGGSWGTALAIALAPRFERAALWVYEKDLAERMQSSRENDVFLSGFKLPTNVDISSDLDAVISHKSLILSVMPSTKVRAMYTKMAGMVDPSTTFVSATKGLENGSLLRATEVIADCLPFPPRVAVLSGPTFAREVAKGDPTAVVVAAKDPELARTVQSAFSGPSLRLYTNSDPTGVEIGGAVKNVVAIGAGVCDGLGLGSNPRAALITRGLAEITRLAVALGGDARTLAGLAGLGDLVLTCTGELSRNRSVGVALAKGRRLEEIVSSMQMVAEGIETTRATVELAQRVGVQMPIAEQMYAMLYGGRPPQEAIRQLMDRSLKGE
jgi:glycerol-3-phosphate dehydrogenase (NAD(P)+)